MTITLLLKIMGGSLLLSSSTIAIVTTLHPESVGTYTNESIKDENAINFYTHINKPTFPTKSSTNFQCKLNTSNKENNKTEPFYCEIYKWDSQNSSTNNQYEAKDLNKFFTKIYDTSDVNNSWIRVKFDKKHIKQEISDLSQSKIEIIPYNQSNVIEAIPILSIDNNSIKGRVQQFVTKSATTGKITKSEQQEICSINSKNESCSIYEFNKSENPTDANLSYPQVNFDMPVIEKGTKQDNTKIPEIKTNHHYIIEFHNNTFSLSEQSSFPQTITHPNADTPAITFNVVKPVITMNINNKTNLFVF